MTFVYCGSAALLGMILGYSFNWAIRKGQPGAYDVASLVSVILGGTTIDVLGRIHCPEALSYYLIGLAVGFVAYLILLSRNWPTVMWLMQHGVLQSPPLFPRHKCTPCGNNHERR